MLPNPFIALLIAAVPGLGPFASLLMITAGVISGIKLAMDANAIMHTVEAKAPELVPAIHHLAGKLQTEPEFVAKTLFAPHMMTNAERDYWTDLLNKNRNL